MGFHRHPRVVPKPLRMVLHLRPGITAGVRSRWSVRMRSLMMFAALVVAVPALSQPSVQPAVTVTATRRTQTVDDTLATVTVISRADIERSQAPDLLTLLRTVPGIDVSRTGGEGQATSLFVRGSNSNQTLILIDGVRVASLNTGSFGFEHLPLPQIERIEIVLGPRASWHGSDAIGGVIQIFTREPRGASARLSAGRWGRLEGSASYALGDADSGVGITVGAIEFDGFSAQKPDGFSYDPDDDGYDNRNLGLRGQHRLGTQQIAAQLLSTRANVDFDQGRTAVDSDVGGITLEGPLGSRLRQRTVLGYSRESLLTPAFGSEFRTRRGSLDWTGDLALGERDSLVFGLNWIRERGRALSVDGDQRVCDYCESRSNLGVFASAQGTRGSYDYQAAVRVDDNSTFDATATGQLAVGWRPSEAVRTFASVGQGFRAPNLNEQYSPGFGGLFAGNPELDPERSHSIELGADWELGAHRLGARAYRTRVRDLIAFEGGSTFQAINVARAALDGIELRWDWRTDVWRVDASATLQDARDEATDLDLLRRPQRKFALGIEREFGALIGGAQLQQVSSRRDFAADLASYALLDLRLDYPLSDAWRIGARLDNATDRDYELAAGFATPRRAMLLTLRYEAP